MQYILSVLLVLSISLSFAGSARAESVAKAHEAAKSWLGLQDEGDYARSWEQLSDHLHETMSKRKWEEGAVSVRARLGKVVSRRFKSAEFTHTVPSLPEGDYLVLQYESQFENKIKAIETVVPFREKNDSWRVMAYFIKLKG
ncbi:DUF4019 domain-containing protein [Iodobacter fluviatilis]|uniref:Uncharacterized protein DUF4019 n=1 Tax=Iodobacter fluviatilis TaxID=537 RepID=A0A377Q6A3_9NEIS|nr:DUF4019 domain-containing protein [Iodobacter fluviatilis]TCU89434.1 uncharacterized protein DUF4019 [Iodobacter fluviatilis]STQ90804.1 Uncharacterised protein [Iodobacter fluviatilis]